MSDAWDQSEEGGASPPPPEAAIAGWYVDPADPAKLRYWDGVEWSDVTTDVNKAPFVPGISPDGSPPPPPSAPTPPTLGFGDIGSWLSESFRVVGRRLGVAILLFWAGPSLLTLVAVFIGVNAISSDSIFVGPKGVINFGSAVPGLVAAAVILATAGVVGWLGYLALIDQLFSALEENHRTVGQSLRLAVRRFLPAVGVGIVAMALAALGLGVGGALGWGLIALLGTTGRAVALLVLVPAAVVAAVWLWVKLAFLYVAVVVNPGSNPFKVSAQVSKDYFWAVFGRLLLWQVVMIGVGFVASILVQIVISMAFASYDVAFDEVTGEATINGIDLARDTFTLAEIMPSVGVIGLVAMVILADGMIRSLLSLGAVTALYRRGGGPSVSNR